MSVFDILTMVGGLALFLYGMEVMGNGLSKGVRRTYGTYSGEDDRQHFQGCTVRRRCNS